MNNLIKNLHKDYRKDEYIKEVMGVAGKELSKTSQKTKNLNDEFFFDTMSAVGIALYEGNLDFKTTGSIGDRRNQIEARWKTAGKCDLELLQTIANSWRNGEIAVLFINGGIIINFISLVGVPYDIENLKLAIETAKPAHLSISWNFIYRTFGMVKNFGETTQYWKDKGYTWGDMRDKEGIS